MKLRWYPKFGIKNALNINGLLWSTERKMKSFLINKNLSFYYWLKKKIGKERAYRVACAIEKIVLIFGRDQVGGTENGGL